MSRSFSSVLVVVLLLTTAIVPGGPTGTAAAAETGECDRVDDFVMFVTLGLVNSDSCSRQAYVNDAIKEMQQSDANQTKVDIYSAAVGQQADGEAYTATYDNYLNDTESVAWMKAETAIAQAYENGSTKSQAKVAARQAIADYYSVKAVNLIEQQNATLHQYGYLAEQAQQETNISADFVRYAGYNGYDNHDIYDSPVTTDPGTTQVTLPNGSTYQAPTMTVSSGNGDGKISIVDPAAARYSDQPDTHSGWWALQVQAPNSNYQDTHVYDFRDDHRRWNRIQSMNDQLQAEANNYVNATWQDFDSGQINSSDVISSHTAMFEYGVRGANESEGLYRSTAALAMMGYDTPNLNSSGTMTIEYRGVEYNGLVMARNAPNGTWSANTTYNTSNIDGPVFMLTTTGEKIDFGDGQEFTIRALKAKDGTTIQQTETTKYVYKTANTTQMLEMQKQLIELRQEIEDREPDQGAGSGGGLDFNLGDAELLGAGAIGVLALFGAVKLLME
ncbi:hypothetical protein SAMN05216559_0133 [Halomicrobium zhouii]|uniref:Envelope protein N-terminal domain-containing protein n=1 Tax=Halomicrobium zhouii TaxID=767519 RepID=A0A1I6K3E9_9EURY|nr:hypothetical protein [Halomicrobium zhouii]SFR85762.1 hypothetical protein SAMN05216559_0133 [Halomicrobium zhouii]